MIRTEELLQARRLDGAEQYFTRAYDYGFSKTLDEAKAKWDEKVILCDVVRVIRNFRPVVVISQFTGTPTDGHGQHQFAGYISPFAIKAAADPSQCTDGGPAWTVKKFYVRHGFRATGEAQLKINTGKYDPLLGRSYFEIAMEARSQHKSQEQGVLELKGDQFSGLNIVVPATNAKEKGIFDGIDTSLTGYLASSGVEELSAISGIDVREDAQDLLQMQTLISEANAKFRHDRPDLIFPILVDLVKLLPPVLRAEVRGLPMNPGGGIAQRYERLGSELARKRDQVRTAIKLAAGIQIDALSNVETAETGKDFSITCNIFYPSDAKVKVKEVTLNVPSAWLSERTTGPNEPSPNPRREVPKETTNFAVRVAKDAKPTHPYWLESIRDEDLYKWPTVSYLTLPFQPPVLYAMVTLEVLGTEVSFNVPVEFRFADDIRGEIRRNVDVVPKVTVEMDQSLMIVPYSEKAQTRQVVMTVTNHSQKAVAGTASLNFSMPVEWKYAATSRTFELKRTGEKTAITFDVTIPARMKAGSYQIAGQAMVGEALANMTMKTIAYPHIQTHRYYRPATVDVKVIDLKTARSKIGYIVGSGDRVPEAIRQMGFDVEIVSEHELAGGDLSRFDVIVVGIRAYQVRPELVANNQRLLDYARNGGTVIVQYQLPGFAQQNLMPYPAQMGPRVADENAKVTILQPEHPMFNFPNKITDADFAGWVQERNLYNFSTMDAAYTPLLESHDAGEAENKGGLVITKVGKGNWVYCSYSMFRQLPAGVPGAYRLFANLLSLPKAEKK